jgi:hypothetical protein
MDTTSVSHGGALGANVTIFYNTGTQDTVIILNCIPLLWVNSPRYQPCKLEQRRYQDRNKVGGLETGTFLGYGKARAETEPQKTKSRNDRFLQGQVHRKIEKETKKERGK